MSSDRPLKLVTVNSAPERARRLVGRVIESFKDRYSIVHVANAESPELAGAIFREVVPDLVVSRSMVRREDGNADRQQFTASMWTPEQSAETMAEARQVNPHVKTLAIPQGLQVERGPDAVVEYLQEKIPAMLQ